LAHASFERCDPHGLVLDDGEQMDDELAHDEIAFAGARRTCASTSS
jgi:hypothetical protein